MDSHPAGRIVLETSEEDCRLLMFVAMVLCTEKYRQRLKNDPNSIIASLKAETLSYQSLSNWALFAGSGIRKVLPVYSKRDHSAV